MAADDGAVRSVTRALDLLGHFTDQRMVWPVAELARVSGLPKTTVVRLVATLSSTGMLWERPDGQVTVGAGLMRWARLARAAWELPFEVRAVLEALAASSRETVNLYVRQGFARVCVAQAEGPQTLRQVVRIGDEMPLWAGAASKILLCDAPADVVDAMVERAGEGLREEIALAADEKFAVSHGEREAGVSGAAAPVVDRKGRIVAALAVGGPTTRFTADEVTLFRAALADAAAEVSRLGLPALG